MSEYVHSSLIRCNETETSASSPVHSGRIQERSNSEDYDSGINYYDDQETSPRRFVRFFGVRVIVKTKLHWYSDCDVVCLDSRSEKDMGQWPWGVLLRQIDDAARVVFGVSGGKQGPLPHQRPGCNLLRRISGRLEQVGLYRDVHGALWRVQAVVTVSDRALQLQESDRHEFAPLRLLPHGSQATQHQGHGVHPQRSHRLQVQTPGCCHHFRFWFWTSGWLRFKWRKHLVHKIIVPSFAFITKTFKVLCYFHFWLK